MRALLVIFAFLHIACSYAVAADASSDQLLPMAQVSLLEVTARQDGRALRLSVRNGGGMVATSLTLDCYPPAASATPSCAKNSVISFDAEALIAEVSGKKQPPKAERKTYYEPRNCDTYIEIARVVHSSTFRKKVVPGDSIELYTELPANVRVDRCTVGEARGREKRWTDF